jgi:F0F1-type ATP synthase membrane subunit b/b'
MAEANAHSMKIINDAKDMAVKVKDEIMVKAQEDSRKAY